MYPIWVRTQIRDRCDTRHAGTWGAATTRDIGSLRSEQLTLHDLGNERTEAVILLADLAEDCLDLGLIGRFGCSARGVSAGVSRGNVASGQTEVTRREFQVTVVGVDLGQTMFAGTNQM